jgi:hypothetical protein
VETSNRTTEDFGDLTELSLLGIVLILLTPQMRILVAVDAVDFRGHRLSRRALAARAGLMRVFGRSDLRLGLRCSARWRAYLPESSLRPSGRLATSFTI